MIKCCVIYRHAVDLLGLTETEIILDWISPKWTASVVFLQMTWCRLLLVCFVYELSHISDGFAKHAA